MRCFHIDWRGRVRAYWPLHVIWIRSTGTRFPHARLLARLEIHKGPWPPLGGSMGDGHGDGGQVARLRRISDAVPFFSVALLISRVVF